MQPILIRMELGTTTGTVPEIAPIMAEFQRKAEDAGVPVRPSLKVREPLAHPQAWDAQAGDEGVVAYLGTLTDKEGAVEALKQITVGAAAVIDVNVLTPDQVEEFQEQARRITELRKQQAEAVRGAANPGRHARQTVAAQPPTHPIEDDGALSLGTPADARTSPVDVLGLQR